MYVPTFQGLGVRDFARSVGHRPTTYPFDAKHQVRFYRARNAIYHLFQALRSDDRRLTALVPDYNSGNEVLAMRAAGVTIQYYPVGPDGQIDPSVVEQFCNRYDPDVLYVIHYLGWPQPMWALTRLCRERRVLLVEDCALALLSALDGRPLGSFGDWAVYCLYKTLPVPNGAILVQNTTRVEALEQLPLHRATAASDAGRTAELFVQRIRSRLNGVGGALQIIKRSVGRAATALDVTRANVGDIGFALADVDLAMSPVSTHLLGRFDFDAIRHTRVQNFLHLSHLLDGRASVWQRELADGVCPLFFPLLVPNKRVAADALRQRGIEALEFWNEGADTPDCDVAPTTRFLRAHVLELPLHQDLTPQHIAYIAHHVTDLNMRMPS
jgi:DegT/DnrJ/EryC1/StrS aminotransferase family protein